MNYELRIMNSELKIMKIEKILKIADCKLTDCKLNNGYSLITNHSQLKIWIQ